MCYIMEVLILIQNLLCYLNILSPVGSSKFEFGDFIKFLTPLCTCHLSPSQCQKFLLFEESSLTKLLYYRKPNHVTQPPETRFYYEKHMLSSVPSRSKFTLIDTPKAEDRCLSSIKTRYVTKN